MTSTGKIVVPRAGLEPARGCPRRILSPLRLPFRHLGTSRSVRLVILGKGGAGGNGDRIASAHAITIDARGEELSSQSTTIVSALR